MFRKLCWRQLGNNLVRLVYVSLEGKCSGRLAMMMRNSASSHTRLDDGKLSGPAGSALRTWSDRISNASVPWVSRQPRGLLILALAALSWGAVGLVVSGANYFLS